MKWIIDFPRRGGKNTMNDFMDFAYKHGTHTTDNTHWDNVWTYLDKDLYIRFCTRSNPGMLDISGYAGTFKIEIEWGGRVVYLCENGGVRQFPKANELGWIRNRMKRERDARGGLGR